MKPHLRLFLLVLLLLALSGCACKHEWIPSDCVNPQVCAKCNETGAPALGHDWEDATCTVPKTCARCGAVEGEALGHSYGEWEFGKDEMSRSCSVCSYMENTEIDREIYLETLLPGYWDFFGMYDDDGFFEASRLNPSVMEFHFGSDRTVTFRMTDQDTQQFTWSFDSYAVEADADSYYFTLTNDEKTYSMCLRHDPSGKLNQPKKQLVLLSGQMLMFSQFDRLKKDLVGDWGIGTEWGIYVGNPGNWLTFLDDRTVTGKLNGSVDGIWHVIPVYSYGNWQMPTSYKILIENNAGESSQLLTGSLSLKSGTSLDFRTGRTMQSFVPIGEKALEQIKLANEIHLGTWTSTEVLYQGKTEKTTSEYSVTFNADGTFVAILGKEVRGTWGVRDIADSNDKDWTNGNSSPVYMYYMFVDGLKKEVYCEVDARLERKHFIIHNYEPMDKRTIDFVQYSKDEYALMMQQDTYLVGKWTAGSFYINNTADNTRTEDPQPENHFFTFNADGTFTAFLNEEISGTWEFDQLDYEDTSTGQYWVLNYLLTFTGSTQAVRIHVQHGDIPEFWLYMPCPEANGYEITAGFQKHG